MSFELWSAFAVSCIAVLIIPGPTVIMIISYALGQGKQTAPASVSGSAVGDFVAMTVSLMGAGALLATSATLFTILKLLGAAYLVWLGIKMWRSQSFALSNIQGITQKTSNYRVFRSTFVVTALNPKSIMFFTAFVPQFIDPHGDLFTQFAILEATFVGLAILNSLIWAHMAAGMRGKMGGGKSLRYVGKVGGSFLIGAGLLTATVQQRL
ncbi:LysE family translocator [Flexibacterium corallicola]|uniref:LysE family translocator n=1 Tax=Flexibacterium corallicola TaxID=3037259 RepID=UPI00286F406D|nr:LysE family translocator [Pseudovibrio sp. M1P-2-3]